MSVRPRKIIGVWDINAAPLKLGFLIIFLEELLQLCKKHGGSADIAFVKSRDAIDYSFIGAMVSFFPRLSSLYIFETAAELDAFLAWKGDAYEKWPLNAEIARTSWHGSTLSIQEFCRGGGSLVGLKGNNAVLKETLAFMDGHLDGALPVVLHLKNSTVDAQSNAVMDSWCELFKHCAEAGLPVKFLLIADDPIDPRCLCTPNVIRVGDFRSSLSLYLGLIEHAFIFMGMSSGPCNMALLSNVPYIIIKHPDHHPEEMERELRGNENFPFAGRRQRFIRKVETPELLIGEFERVYNSQDADSWRKQRHAH